MINLRRGGTWGDIYSSRIGLMVLAYPQGNNVKIETVNRLGEIVDVKTIFFDEPLLFVRVASNNGSVVVCGQGNPSGKFYIKGVNVNIPDPKLITYGTHICDVIFDNGVFRFVCQTSETEYYDSIDREKHTIPQAIWGTSQGIIQLLPSGPQWSDLVRQSISEMLFPYEMPNLFIGEGQEDPAHIECLDGTEHKNIYQGFAERPRAANIDNNLLGIATRDAGGTFFLLMERPYPNFTEEIPPVVEPPPVIEPPIPPEPKPEPPMNENYVPVGTPDPELTTLANRLDLKYNASADQGGLGRGPTETFVDPLGQSRWRRDYFIHRDKGDSPDAAWKKVNKAINDIVGLPGDIDPNPHPPTPISTTPGGSLSGDVNV